MRWVQQAALYPHRCAVLPYVGNSSTRFGFLDTGMDVDNERIYLSGEFFNSVIPQMGYIPEGKTAGLEAKVDQLEATIAELKAERDDLKSQMDAIAVLKSAGYRGEKQPGRPPKNREKVSG